MVEGRRRGDGVLLLLSAAQTAPLLLLLLLLLRPLRLLLCRDEACRRARARAEAEINPRAAVRGSCVSSEQLRGVQTPLAAHSAHARTHTSVARPRRALARSFQRAPAWRGRGGGGGGHPLLCHLSSPTTRTPRHCASAAARYGSGKGQGASLQPPHWARADTGAKRRAARGACPFVTARACALEGAGRSCWRVVATGCGAVRGWVLLGGEKAA